MKGEKWIYPITLFAFLCLRAFGYSYFSGNYTDSDQCVMWQMADDFAHFRFHTPFFLRSTVFLRPRSLARSTLHLVGNPCLSRGSVGHSTHVDPPLDLDVAPRTKTQR